MTVPFFRRFGAVLVALASLGGAAFAQSPACNAWRSELASLQGQRGGDPRAAQAAQRVGAQLAQVTGQYRAMGCDRGFSLFGEGPPPQCGLLRSQIGQLQAQYGAAQRQAEGGGVEQRRAQLAAAIDNNCRPQQRGFFETIFGIEPRRGEIDTTLPELQPDQPPQEPEKPRMGGAYTVCVRSCDGFFFPLANNPGNADEMCQALCPGAETTAFGMTSGGDIQNSVSRSSGQPYTSLPNAGKYQRSFDAACTCRGQGQSWAQALKDAEYLLDKRKGDIIVTEQRAAELSRPRVDPKRRGATPAIVQPAAIPDVPDEKPMPSENSPTAGTESAGVGPDTIGEKVLDKGDGVKSETKSVTGEKRTVRIISPNLAPNLGPSATRQ
ncbi:DUF2865 domain-containing protein [Bosea psychrotolerans]|uniref:Uncharacterized protein DUF2865 n=1 Tax=Bosea psychrotolerans TaxID=1871628 RepID=A0A2S4MC98_9HYPH|nr:DUF2865 domain-containing protein [Bosea psychrotolerans]POR52352.1 uncharacterized protein DUF2865 [Bosea psychrotolerans]